MCHGLSLQHIFWLQDKDKNGYVDVDELTNLHSTTKERLTMLEAKKILQVQIDVHAYM